MGTKPQLPDSGFENCKDDHRLSQERPSPDPLDYADFYGEASVKSYSVHPVARRKVSRSIEETSRPGRPRRKLPRNLKEDRPVSNRAGTEVSKTFREFESEMPRTTSDSRAYRYFIAASGGLLWSPRPQVYLKARKQNMKDSELVLVQAGSPRTSP